MRKFFEKYEYSWEYEYPFGEDFLKSIFQEQYKRKYSLTGDGIYNLIFIEDKIYSVDFKKVTNLLPNDGKLAFRDSIKDKIVAAIANKLKENNIIYTVSSGKFITFQYYNFIFKIEVIKKTIIPS